MALRDFVDNLPPGHVFYPTDDELVSYYLSKKNSNEEIIKNPLVEIDLKNTEPWSLPDVAKLNSKEWYFFSFQDRRENRATASGYWKSIGKGQAVRDERTRAIVGKKETLIFYTNKAPNGIKTGWVMHEFLMSNPQANWMLCKVFNNDKDSNYGADQNIAASSSGSSRPKSK